MLRPFLLNYFLTRIRIAILAQMWAGVVLADVFAPHAAAELPLAFVAVVLFLQGVLRFAEHDSIGRNRLGAKQRVFYGLNLHTEEVHQNLVVMRKANHQVIIHATVVLDAVWRKVYLLATGGQLVVPLLVEF